MGSKSSCVTKAALGKPVEVGVLEGYRLWSSSYDQDANPILALERRVIGCHLDNLQASSLLDIATGTGYWLLYARSRGVRAFGLDLSAEMLRQAAKKPGLRHSLLCADMNEIPLRDSVADVAICSLAVGYIAGVEKLFAELARVSRRVIVSDLHERAIEAGWNRCFRADGRHYQIAQFKHSAAELDDAAKRAGMRMEWRESSYIDEPERPIFNQARREYAFDAARQVPAILATCWSRA